MRRSAAALALALMLPLPGLAGEVLVRPGDTLSEIAERYGTTVERLRQLNGLRNDTDLWAGSRIQVPGAGGDAGRGGGATGSGNYTVKPGDTLSEIAERYGTTVERLRQLNGLRNDTDLWAGSRIQVPGASPARAATPAAVNRNARTHTVQPGETLSEIADRYDIPMNRLVAINGLRQPDDLQAGSTLRLRANPTPAAPRRPRPAAVATRPTPRPTVKPATTTAKVVKPAASPAAPVVRPAASTTATINPAPVRTTTPAPASTASTTATGTGSTTVVATAPATTAATTDTAAAPRQPKPAAAAASTPSASTVGASATPGTAAAATTPTATTSTNPTSTNPASTNTASTNPAPTNPAAARPTATASAPRATTRPAPRPAATANGTASLATPDWRSYGPLQVDWANWTPMAGSYVAPSLNSEGQPLYLAINCGARRLNATGQSGTWKTWDAPQSDFEEQLISDLCRSKGT